MKKAIAVAAALLRCGVFGVCYGAVCGVVLPWLIVIGAGIVVRNMAGGLWALSYGVPMGLLLGIPAGFLAGVIGGCLGGPLGWSVGGAVGPAAFILPIFDTRIAALACLMGSALGLICGRDLRRPEPRLVGGRAVAKSVYLSPLGVWLGWRRCPLKPHQAE